ncbi:MAG TPA: M3 family metallopeptidase [Acidiferrobacterales bacterium]|nr:M3 family metallopeptidase [Acidiferrobacterales bacterium]
MEVNFAGRSDTKLQLIAAVVLTLGGVAHAKQAGEVWQPEADVIGPKCDAAVAEAKRDIAKLESLPLEKASRQTVLYGWNRLDTKLEDVSDPVFLLSEVSPKPEVRKAAEECVLNLSSLENQIYQSAALYQRFKSLAPFDPIDKMAQQILLEQFEDRGVNLAEDKREQARKIFDRLDKLQQDFARNLRDNKTKLNFTAEELAGVPEDFLATTTRDEHGNYLIGFDYPEIDAVMGYAENGETRRRYQFEVSRRGTEQNLAILAEVVKLRKELATLLGYPSYAHWSARRKMVERPEVIEKFLADVASKVEEIEKRELAELAQEKARHTGETAAKIRRWDVAFYQQRLKKARYSVDPQIVRQQFPTEPTIAWLMQVTSRLYGIEFRPNPDLPVWHREVRGYDVYDRADGKYLASFYLDLFPREGKYKHAAAFGIRGASTLASRTPVSALVTNFRRDGFDQNELETLFHEFGHVMHNVLSKTRYLWLAGTAVRRDFVEAPSQMYEEWARRPASLRLFNATCRRCKPIDMELIRRMDAARRYGQGTKYARQRLYAAYDMALASDNPGDPMQVWVEMEAKTPLGHVPGTQFPGTFGHIVGGYAAGYYGYMWSEVLALDMLSPFGENLMDEKVGRRYRQIVLENGGQIPPMQLVERFLGRKPSPEAFFQEITGRRGAAPAVSAKGSKQ